MAMATSVNRYQRYQPANRQRHKSWKGKALESNTSSHKNDGQRSYTYGTQQSGSFKVTCRHCKKDGHTERVCRFKQADLNKASWPQAQSVEIQGVNDDESEYFSDNGEDHNEEVYIQAYHINTDGGKKKDHDTWFLDNGWRSIKNYQPYLGLYLETTDRN